MQHLLQEIKKCTICASELPFGANPVVQASSNSKICIIGQAPGKKCMNPELHGMIRVEIDLEAG